jgi:hypothetical protein
MSNNPSPSRRICIVTMYVLYLTLVLWRASGPWKVPAWAAPEGYQGVEVFAPPPECVYLPETWLQLDKLERAAINSDSWSDDNENVMPYRDAIARCEHAGWAPSGLALIYPRHWYFPMWTHLTPLPFDPRTTSGSYSTAR